MNLKPSHKSLNDLKITNPLIPNYLLLFNFISQKTPKRFIITLFITKNMFVLYLNNIKKIIKLYYVEKGFYYDHSKTFR